MPLYFINDTLILDASCVITLYASQQMENILRSIPKAITVAAYVFDKEALFIRTEPDEYGKRGKEKIDLQSFINRGLIRIVDIQSEDEAEEFVTLATKKIAQGEAITGAIAIKRSWSIVIDDKRAHQVLSQRASHLQLINTLELVNHWVESDLPSNEVITKTLQSIRRGAAYSPPKEHPLYQWWHRYQGG